MKLPRREFLQKSGLFAAAGFLSPYLNLFDQPGEKPSFTGQNSFLIVNAQIISMDEGVGDLEKGSVLVQNGRITEIAERIEEPGTVEIIDGAGAIVMPGLIDCHWHLWTSLMRSMSGDIQSEGYFPMTAEYSRYFTPEDMKIAALYAAAEALHSGITTITDYNHNARSSEFVMASFDALSELGIRGRVEYNGYRDKPSGEPTDFQGIQRVLQQIDAPEYHLLSLGLGSRGAGYENLTRDWEKARELGLRITIHASSTEEQEGQIWQLEQKGLLGSDVNIIHGNAITPEEITAVARAGTSITITPFSEMRIGYGLPRINDLLEAGINISVGIDTTALSGNGDLFSVMKVIRNLANAKAKDEFYLKAHDVLKMATINGAKTLGLDDKTGSLTPGKEADILMLRKDDLNFSTGNKTKNLLVEATLPANVDFVSVGGKILKRDGKLTTIEPQNIIERAEASFHRIYKEVKKEN